VRKAAPTLTLRDQIVVEKALCERSFKDFVRIAWKQVDTAKYVHNWHVDALADHLQACAEGKIKRLLINICPGSAKSTIVNVLFPAWLWTIRPEARIISASYSEKLSIRDSLKTRRLIQSQWFQRRWAIHLQDDQNAKAKFENGSLGSREACPMGSMTGSRGNFVIIDDPHSVDDAKSAATRSKVVDTFLSSIPSRLNEPANDVIIVVMQRLHEDDVSGIILERPGLGYEHLCIPLLAGPVEDRIPTSIGWVDPRAEGENMFPARFDEEVVKGYKASLGPLQFAGQYQQTPAPADDGFFKRHWFHRFEPGEQPKNIHIYMTSDHAPSGNNDYNVFRVWGVDSNRNLWLLDSFRKRCTMNVALGIERDHTGKTIISSEGAFALMKKWKPHAWFPENDPTWSAIRPMVEAAMLETRTFVKIEALPTKGAGDKTGKAVPYQAMAAMGMVHIPNGEIGEEALAEYAVFPVGKRDDQVDADGAIARVLDEATPAFVPVPQKSKLKDAFADEQAWDSMDDCWA